MASRRDEYRKQAEYCRLEANKAKRKEERVEWLSMAATWQGMADAEPDPRDPPAKKESR